MDDYLTISELATAFGVTDRTVRRDLAKAGDRIQVVDGEASGWSGKGTPKKLVSVADYRRHLAAKRGRGKKQAPKKTASSKKNEAAANPANESGINIPNDPDQAAAAVEAMLTQTDVNPDDVLAMRDRLAAMEAAAHLKLTQAFVIGDDMTALTVTDSWNKLIGSRRQLEKELPGILASRGRYVDALAVNEVLTKAATNMDAELDQIGVSCAELCVGQSAKEIRRVIDAAVASAKLHITEALEEQCRKPTATE